MTSKYFDDMIEQMLDVNGGEEDKIINGIRQIIDSFDDDASHFEIFRAIDDFLNDELARITESGDELEADSDEVDDLSETDEGVEEAFTDEEYEQVLRELGALSEEPEAVSNETDEYIESGCNVVRAFLEDNGWTYVCNRIHQKTSMFELGLNAVNNCTLRIRIVIEADPRSCHIEAVLPVVGDSTYEYIICKELARLNYIKRFGAFHYDSRDGEITYEYTFQANKGIAPEKLETAFHAVVQTAAKGYPDIRKCCVGRFKKGEVAEILSKVEAIIDALCEE